MKKTLLILSAVAAAAVAQANEVYTTFTTTGSSNASFTLTGDVTGTMNKSAGNFFLTPAVTWSNDAALEAMNAELGTTITADQLSTVLPPGAGGSRSTLTLNFTNSDYQSGDKVSIYFTMGANAGAPSITSFTGLENMVYEYASFNGDGFGATGLSTATATPTLVHVTGTLTDALTVTIQGSTNKSGFGMVAVVPEPTTATLSLLALAGLAARRRRK